MAEQQTVQQEVAKRKIKVKNAAAKGSRFIFDASGKQNLLGPGEEAEIEVTESAAKQLEEQSAKGSDIQVEGHDAEESEPLAPPPEIPEEQKSRVDLAGAERDELEAGQEADQERREKVAKRTGEQLAAETGIHMHARGLKPEVKAAPEDAPAKKK